MEEEKWERNTFSNPGSTPVLQRFFSKINYTNDTWILLNAIKRKVIQHRTI